MKLAAYAVKAKTAGVVCTGPLSTLSVRRFSATATV